MASDLASVVNSGATIKQIEMQGIEKRYVPMKHYVFILQVTWSDDAKHTIYRTYGMFFDFHMKLLDSFPIEAGSYDEKDKVIPYLPGRKLFQNTETLKVAAKRQFEIGKYCNELIQLPPKISQNPIVLKFFQGRLQDQLPQARKGQESLANKVTGKVSSLLPSKLLTKLNWKDRKSKQVENNIVVSAEEMDISGPIPLDSYRALADYEAQSNTQVSFRLGDVLDVIEMNESGWWFVQLDHLQGWAPASYLEPVNQEADDNDPPMEDEKGEPYITIHSYQAQVEDELSFKEGTLVNVMHKLLDGWWIVSLGDMVGYAPSSYLRPNDTDEDDYIIPQVKRPQPPRRCSDEKLMHKPASQKTRDLTFYRKRSKEQLISKNTELLPLTDDDYVNTSGYLLPVNWLPDPQGHPENYLELTGGKDDFADKVTDSVYMNTDISPTSPERKELNTEGEMDHDYQNPEDWMVDDEGYELPDDWVPDGYESRSAKNMTKSEPMRVLPASTTKTELNSTLKPKLGLPVTAQSGTEFSPVRKPKLVSPTSPETLSELQGPAKPMHTKPDISPKPDRANRQKFQSADDNGQDCKSKLTESTNLTQSYNEQTLQKWKNNNVPLQGNKNLSLVDIKSKTNSVEDLTNELQKKLQARFIRSQSTENVADGTNNDSQNNLGRSCSTPDIQNMSVSDNKQLLKKAIGNLSPSSAGGENSWKCDITKARSNPNIPKSPISPKIQPKNKNAAFASRIAQFEN